MQAKSRYISVASCGALCGVLLCVLLISLLEFRLVWMLHENDLDGIADLHEGIVSGEAYFNLWQSRLLGAYLAQGFSYVTGTVYFTAVLYTFLLLQCLKNIIFFWVIRGLTKRTWFSVLVTALFALGFLLLQDKKYLFIWDVIDMMVFTLLIYGALRKWPVSFFAGLFVVALPNREVALFIPLYLIISAFNISNWHDFFRLKWWPLQWPRLIVGVVLFVAGLLALVWLRDVLQIAPASVQPDNVEVWKSGAPIALTEVGMFNLWVNALDLVYDSWRSPTQYMNFLPISLAVVLPYFAWRFRQYLQGAWWPLIATHLGIYLSLWLFAYLVEARVWLIMLPFVVIFFAQYYSSRLQITLVKQRSKQE